MTHRPPRLPALFRHWLLTGLITVAAWIVCETVGGLIFLACGVRLWSYHIAPVFWEITSLVGWIFVWFVAGNLIFFYLMWETQAAVAGQRRWLYRAIFLMVAGPINEVIWNTIIWRVTETPLYLYTVLPTFDGSGSLLSPLYYLTLLLGFWIEEQVPGTLAGSQMIRIEYGVRSTGYGEQSTEVGNL